MGNRPHKKILLLCVIFVFVVSLVIIVVSSQSKVYKDYSSLDNSENSEIIVTNRYQGVIISIFSFLTKILPSYALNKVVFTEFPQMNKRESLKATTYISTIVINTDPLEPMRCPGGNYSFEYFVLLTNKESIMQGSCSTSYSQSNAYEYLNNIGREIHEQKGLPLFTANDLQRVTVFIGKSQPFTNIIGN